MRKYKVESHHLINLDDYKEGELEQVNLYELSKEIDADTPEEAVRQYIEEVLHYKNNSFEKDEECGWFTDTIVDVENTEPSMEQINRWQKNKEKLYNDHTKFTVYEMNLITPI